MIAPGFIQQFQTHCHVCSGRGKIFKSTCKSCDGKKVLRQSESLKFKVPAGAPEDFVIVKITNFKPFLLSLFFVET